MPTFQTTARRAGTISSTLLHHCFTLYVHGRACVKVVAIIYGAALLVRDEARRIVAPAGIYQYHSSGCNLRLCISATVRREEVVCQKAGIRKRPMLNYMCILS